MVAVRSRAQISRVEREINFHVEHLESNMSKMVAEDKWLNLEGLNEIIFDALGGPVIPKLSQRWWWR